MFTSSAGHPENMIGFPGGYSRVEQPMPLLLPGCKRNTDDIFDIELSATAKQQNLKNEWSKNLCLPLDSDIYIHKHISYMRPDLGPGPCTKCPVVCIS